MSISADPRPNQPQRGSLPVSHLEKEGLLFLAMFSCSLQEFVQNQWYCRQSYDLMQLARA